MKFHSSVSNGIFGAMPDMTKTEEFDLVVQAVKASTAPAEIVAAFNELSTLREQLKRFGEPESYYLKGMNCPHHHRTFAAETRSYQDMPLRRSWHSVAASNQT
jgi:hypothetical protein